MKRIIRVVGAIIKNNNEYLCTLRSPMTNPPNLWDLPGGEIKEGESLESAIAREISSSLKCVVRFVNLISSTTYEYDDNILNLITVEGDLVSGNPCENYYTKILWLKKENLLSLNWSPSTLPIIKDIVNQS